MATVTFNKGTGQSWVVPTHVTQIYIDAFGAQGQYNGGAGGEASGSLTTTPGETLYIAVGGQDGTNGGGGGGGTRNGGGMTWLSRSSSFSTSTVIIVGAGGGGGAFFAGGAGGGTIGTSAYATSGTTAAGGGTQSAGGAAGTGSFSVSAGGPGQGGNSSSSNYDYSGAGGGGYYGGGAGSGNNSNGFYNGGGGGSSYLSSSLASPGTNSGVETGDGVLTITYFVPLLPSVSDSESSNELVTFFFPTLTLTIYEPEPVSETSDLHIPGTQPLISFRTAYFPYGLLQTPLVYSGTVAKQSGLPVLAGDNSDTMKFRIYNNFGLIQDISTAYNMVVTTYDDVTHDASTPLVTQQWINLQENGYGINSTTANVFTSYQDNLVFVGGPLNVKNFAIGADGNSGSNIPAGTDRDGCGFIEVNTYCKIPLGQVTAISNAVLSVAYDWSS